MREQARIETAIDTTIDNCEVLRARLAKYEDADGKPITTIAEQAREIERLNGFKSAFDEWHDKTSWVQDEFNAGAIGAKSLGMHRADVMAQLIHGLRAELAAMKAQPSGVVQWPDADEIMQMAFEEGQPSEDASGYYFELEEFDLFIQRLMEEVARLNSSPVTAGDSALREAVTPHVVEWVRCGLAANNRLVDGDHPALQKLRAALSANHSEQVLEGWQLVPVEPIDAMLEAGDKYIGTPATYKAMLSACPSPAITKDFSQFLSAVMDAAGLIRHGRQSKELSEYLGMKCMEYRGVAPSAGSQKEQGE